MERAYAYIARWGKTGGDKVAEYYEYAMRRDYLSAAVIAGLVIGVGMFMGWANNNVVPLDPGYLPHYHGTELQQLNYLSNWDGPIYLRLAQHGYMNVNDTNFFPLYPLLIRTVHEVTRLPLILGALLISWACFAGAAYFYIKIVRILFRTRTTKEAVRGLLLFALFPTAVFMIATYTEALTALTTLAAIYYALKNRYLLAGLWLVPATATHITGMFAVALVGLILLEQKVVGFWKATAAVAIGSLGLLSFMAYLQVHSGSAIAFITAQQKHGWLNYSPQVAGHDFGWLNFLMLLMLLGAAWYWWQRRRSFAVYSLLFLIIPIIGSQFGGFNRYMLMNYSVPLMAYGLFRNHKLGYPIVLCGSLILWTYFLMQYAGGYVGG